MSVATFAEQREVALAECRESARRDLYLDHLECEEWSRGLCVSCQGWGEGASGSRPSITEREAAEAASAKSRKVWVWEGAGGSGRE